MRATSSSGDDRAWRETRLRGHSDACRQPAGPLEQAFHPSLALSGGGVQPRLRTPCSRQGKKRRADPLRRHGPQLMRACCFDSRVGKDRSQAGSSSAVEDLNEVATGSVGHGDDRAAARRTTPRPASTSG
ncbi:hypothetical protein PRIC1_009683 [Phytophthora ramorum]